MTDLYDAHALAMDRLQAIVGSRHGTLARESVPLAFGGFDITHGEVTDLTGQACEPYSMTLLDVFSDTWSTYEQATSAEEVFAAGVKLGERVNSILYGVYTQGLLTGELHARNQGKATSDD